MVIYWRIIHHTIIVVKTKSSTSIKSGTPEWVRISILVTSEGDELMSMMLMEMMILAYVVLNVDYNQLTTN